jgi:transposase
METIYFLGVDISKKTIDTALTIDGKHFNEVQVDNQTKTVESFLENLKKQIASFSKLIVCMEHTGIYCLPLLNVLTKLKIKVCVEPALQIKQSQGMTRGKTDQVDARRIALYAIKNKEHLVFWKPQRLTIQKLKALLVTRERLLKMRKQLAIPIEESQEFVEEVIWKEMVKCCSNTIRALNRDIEKIDSEIDKVVKSDTQLSEQFLLITSVPGIGKLTALNMIISTGEFKRITEAKKFACYAGVAPFEHSSGISYRGKTRVSKMANMTLKRLLHLAAMSAIKCCDELKAFYHRKVEAGKNKMSVINAVRNKLISRVFACINNGRKYQKILKCPLHES